MDEIEQFLQSLLLASIRKQSGVKPPVSKSKHSKQTKKSGSGCSAIANKARSVESALDAARKGDLPALAKLVTNAKAANWTRNGQGWSLLDAAVRSQSIETVRWLLDMGANPNTLFRLDAPHLLCHQLVPGWYFSPFATAIRKELHEIALLLVSRGASPELPIIVDKDGDITTCREAAIEMGVWPRIEACLIAKSMSVVTTTNGAKRL